MGYFLYSLIGCNLNLSIYFLTFFNFNVVVQSSSNHVSILCLILCDVNLVVQGSALEFARVVNAKRQVVAGTLHDLMVEVVDSGKKSVYKAKVWVKPWQNFKAVVEFRHAGDFQSESSESSVASDGSTGQGILGLTSFLNI